MRFIDYLANLLFRHQKKLEALAVFLLCFSISFRFGKSGTQWLWNDYSFVAVLFVISVIIIALIWVRIEKTKTGNLINSIKQNSTSGLAETNQLDELSARQREVFDLILQGKSNKEIMSELYIELSTLKTHINKIYKILDIASRKQVRGFKNTDQ